MKNLAKRRESGAMALVLKPPLAGQLICNWIANLNLWTLLCTGVLRNEFNFHVSLCEVHRRSQT